MSDKEEIDDGNAPHIMKALLKLGKPTNVDEILDYLKKQKITNIPTKTDIKKTLNVAFKFGLIAKENGTYFLPNKVKETTIPGNGEINVKRVRRVRSTSRRRSTKSRSRSKSKRRRNHH